MSSPITQWTEAMRNFLKIQAIVWLVFIPLTLMAVGYLERLHVVNLIGLYGLMSVGRIVVQSYLARRVRTAVLPAPRRWPKASIIVATYNEDPTLFRRSMQSLSQLYYPDYEVIVVDDGSKNQALYKRLTEQFGYKYIYQANAGKRHAMYRAFAAMDPRSRIVLTADSDTLWMPDAATELVKALAQNQKVGAATGYVAVENAEVNLLTKVCDLRYWMAFNQERAAQSAFGVVTCVSGPLGAYRRHLIDEIKEEFVSQRFLGKPCTFGDDRHLTNLVLGRGYEVRYAPDAMCLSDCPTTLNKYLKQQARWGKSHWREMIWQFKALPQQSLYLAYDWYMSLALPFLLVASLAHYGFLALTVSPLWLVKLFGMIILMSLVRIIVPLLETRNPAFFLFVGYTAFSILVLLPLKFYSLATINITGWGTRA